MPAARRQLTKPLWDVPQTHRLGPAGEAWRPRPAYLRGVRVLVLQLFQIQLVDLSENQQLPVQELHLLLD